MSNIYCWHGHFGVCLIYVSPVLLTGTLYVFFHTFFKRYFITIPLKPIRAGKPRDYSDKSLMSRVLHKPPASQPTHSALVWQCPALHELTIDDVCLDALQCYHTLQICWQHQYWWRNQVARAASNGTFTQIKYLRSLQRSKYFRFFTAHKGAYSVSLSIMSYKKHF